MCPSVSPNELMPSTTAQLSNTTCFGSGMNHAAPVAPNSPAVINAWVLAVSCSSFSPSYQASSALRKLFSSVLLFVVSHLTPSATRGAVWPPERLEHRVGALLSPAPFSAALSHGSARAVLSCSRASPSRASRNPLDGFLLVAESPGAGNFSLYALKTIVRAPGLFVTNAMAGGGEAHSYIAPKLPSSKHTLLIRPQSPRWSLLAVPYRTLERVMNFGQALLAPVAEGR
jgi:hypothetical protein